MGRTTETNSLEVRWFGEGSTPRALDEWIAGLGSVESASRTDLYLSPPTASFNLKLRREGGEFVELKRRLGGAERRSFGPDVTGDVEQWYKWSFSLDHSPGLWTSERTGLWLPVRKARTLHALDPAERPSSGGGPPDGDATAHVELTEVTVPSGTAWTVGLEVAGRAAALEDAFAAVASEAFGGSFPVSLPAERSVGYSEWLRRLGEGTGAAAVLVPSNR
jgi:hypothetical protein